MSECKDSLNIKSIYFLNPDDFVFDKNGNILRKKRKYGKFKRECYKYDVKK